MANVKEISIPLPQGSALAQGFGVDFRRFMSEWEIFGVVWLGLFLFALAYDDLNGVIKVWKEIRYILYDRWITDKRRM